MTFLDLSTMMWMKNSLKLPRIARALVIALVLVITAIGAYSQQAGDIVDFTGVPDFQRKDGLIQAKITDDTAATTQAIDYEVQVVNPGAGYQKTFVFAKSAGAPLADTEQVFKVVEKGASGAQLVYSGMVGGTTTVLTLPQTETDGKVTVTPPSSVDLDPITMGDQTDPGATLVVEAPGFHGQVISFTYSFIAHSTAVDSIAPTITNVTPLDKAATKPGAFIFAADVVDLDSGFTEDSKELKPAAMADPGAGGFTINVASSAFGPQRLDLTPIENGWHLALHGSVGAVGSTLDMDWFVVATDAAGNTETLQTRKLTVDGEQPKFVSATTGHWWDPQEPATSRLRTGLNARRDNLRLTFTDGSGLDEATIGPGDFTVDTSILVSILVIDVVNEAMTPPKRERPLDVFLTLPVELASDARPLVAVEGEILDRAGNPVDISSSLLASDGLPPKFSVSLDNPLSKEAVAITIEADEFLQAVPVVRLDTQTGADGSLGNENVTPTLASISTRSYSLTSKVDAGPGANTARKVNLRVTATDASGITGTAGKANALESGAITFELDPVLNNGLDPEFTVAGIPLLPGGKVLVTDDGTTTKAAQIEVVSPLMIIADFSRQCTVTSCQTGGEAKEYEGDSYKTVELTSASASVSLADGSKETPPVLMKSSDNVKYTLIILEPPLGDYTITLQARDAAGNVAKVAGTPAPSDLTNSFSLISPKPVEIALAPGWSLVSLPFHPPNPAINAIVPPDHSINFVMAYDIATQVWHASRRDADTGLLEGDVGAMTADTAYFVHTDTFEPLSLFLPSGARLGTVLPIPASLPLTLGWNLVPVVSRALPPPPGVEADLYFKSAKWLEAQSYQPLTKSWESIVPAQVSVGNQHKWDRLGPEKIIIMKSCVGAP